MRLYRESESESKSVIRRPAEQLNVAGLGADALRVNNKILTMLMRGRLVVKLPKARVDALASAGQGARFDAN